MSITEKIYSSVMDKEWLQVLKEILFISSPETESCSEITCLFCVPVLCVATLQNTASVF